MSPNFADKSEPFAFYLIVVVFLFAFLAVMTFPIIEAVFIVLASSIIIIALAYKPLLKPSEGPFQELKILVNLPPGTDVKVAPLLLNSVDSALFSFLLQKCTRTLDNNQILLHYKRNGEIYDPKRNVFNIKDATYKPTRLKVVYYRPS